MSQNASTTSRRKKRDLQERAFSKGYLAGVSGRSQDICPHDHDERRMQWISGWREGRTDRVEGYTGIRGVERRP